MSEIFTKSFLIMTAERAIKTFCQSLLAVLLVGSTIATIAWGPTLVAAGTATLISVLTSVVSAGAGPRGTPSLVGEPPSNAMR